MLTKDQKIRYRAAELLSLAEQARMFDEARTRIDRAVSRHEARFYQVYAGGRVKRFSYTTVCEALR